MSKPQQPELGRSRRTPGQDPDSAATVIEGSRPPVDDAPHGVVPPENRPGHHPADEQDRPDLDAFAERLGTAGGGTVAADAARAAGPGGRSAPGQPAGGRRDWRGVALLGAAGALVVHRVARRRTR